VALTALAAIVFLASCGGGGEETTAAPPATTAAVVAETTEATVGSGQSETVRDQPFSLNTEQPIPADFEAAYQRNALITVQFYKPVDDPFYPQGLSVDTQVQKSLEKLRQQYPTVEFFTYDITDPGTATEQDELREGQYGTLAAQLGVGLTPFVATMAPSENGYVIENLYQGFTPRAVLSQALFDLTANDVASNTSDIDVSIEQLELTDEGGGLEYVTIRNRGAEPVNLVGFGFNVLDLETGEVNPDTEGILISSGENGRGEIQLEAGQEVSVGRTPDIVDQDGERVAGTFSGGEDLDLAPGDQVALLDSGGAVADTFVV
jgi:hypothetical protein